MELVTVRTFDNYFSASIILTRLQSDGVECYLKDEHTVTIVVNKLLEEYHLEYIKSAACPQCGANNFTQVTKKEVGNYLTAIFTWLFSNYAVAPNYIYQCGNCGYECETLPDAEGNTSE
jgi:predicted nucleic-acid-binding Zn-ribbon protein